MRQTLAGVARAHETGIVHRDLKPENIMILRRHNDDGEEIDWVKVCDFGIAKMNDPEREDPSERRLSLKGHMMGTPEYMSPEQARGDALDVRSDIYALGVVLYQMLVGRVPFEGPTPLDIAVKHLTSEPVPPRERLKGIDPALEVICLTAMSKEPSQRYQSAREMRAVLRAAQDGRPLSSVAPDATGAFPSIPPLYTPPPSSRMSLDPLSGSARPSHSGSVLTPVGVAAPTQRASSRKHWLLPAVALLGLLGGYVGYTRFSGARSLSGAGAEASKVERLLPISNAFPTATTTAPTFATSAMASASAPSLAPAPGSVSSSASASASAKNPKVPVALPPTNGEVAPKTEPPDAAPPVFSASHTARVTIASGPAGNVRNSIQSRLGGLRACYGRSLDVLNHCAAGQATLVVTLNDKQMVATATLTGTDFLPSISSCSSIFPGLMIEEPEAQSATFGIAFTCD